MRFSNNWLTLLLFISGLAITLLGSYYIVTGLYRYLFWQEKEGVIVDIVVKEMDDEYSYHEKAVFTDPNGRQIEVVAFSGVGDEEDTREGEVTILFNPENTSEAAIVQARDFLIIVLIPFGLLLLAIGWPFKKL